jgi:hypothetical protein
MASSSSTYGSMSLSSVWTLPSTKANLQRRKIEKKEMFGVSP